ncbi:MAG: bacillithiol biosynthesis deacetylase BshB1 [Chitinophagaceae bacterium]
MLNKINLLAFAAHPDDVEISASGIMIKHQQLGLSTGIVDLTRGELGTRGSADIRDTESAKATEIMKLKVRENLGFKDGFFEVDEFHLLKVITAIRKYQPDIVLINSESDRHPDHGRAHNLLKRACFLSGLPKIVTPFDGEELVAWRPKTVYSYIQDYFIEPHLVVDVSEVWDQRMLALKAFSSQFYDPQSSEPLTPISNPEFFKFIEGRGMQFGRYINSKFGEGLRTIRPAGVENLSDLN